MFQSPALHPSWRKFLWPVVAVVGALLLAGCAIGGSTSGSVTGPSNEQLQRVTAKITPGRTQYFTYGSGKTAHQFIVYTPKGYTSSSHMPLVVLLHGCQTTAYQQMQASDYNPLADKKGFVVVYPDTDASENAQSGDYSRCWDYYHSSDWHRGQGDGAAVAGITRQVISHWHINTQRVYIMGMSAGSFLAADLATEYPDLYAASGENAGSAYADYRCLYVYNHNDSFTAAESAAEAFKAEGRYARVVPRIVIGGSADTTVWPACADKALAQSLRTNNLVTDHKQTGAISLIPASVRHYQVPNGHAYKVSDYVDQHGCLVGQRYLVYGMQHRWSGGSANPSLSGYSDPKGPSAAVASWNFFSRFTLSNTSDPCG
jgi:poly(hydroxyalkanoate) depolymerase family esterase